jgi:hypothetical protein
MKEYFKTTAARIIIITIITAGGSAALSTVAMAETAPANSAHALTARSAQAPVPTILPRAVLNGNTPWG